MRLKKKPWGEQILQEYSEYLILAYELDEPKFQNFLKHPKLVLEIGAGKGDFALQMAKKYPDIHFVAIEMQSMALAYALRKIQDEKIENLLFVNVDAHFLFEKLYDYKFETIFLNFSDPWPKKRQNKRRLTYPTMLKEYYNILKDDGRLIFKSDNDVLFNDSVEYLKESQFKLIDITYDYDGLDPYDALTEYESRFRNLNVPIKRFIVGKE
ncbi:MAG: tRNA (guanosine(46)-N7)-methyltransferase TrmB [Erysipelotrichaceae bacterium]|jgi:tRNA (guanine-N7-)-methyltransferase|nr:tRNA (guanosine(46)-N7)-methyltransferase TrmB [Erysipelotrichaceae bacterium]